MVDAGGMFTKSTRASLPVRLDRLTLVIGVPVMSLPYDRAKVVRHIQRVMIEILRKQRTASADDVWRRVTIPPHVHPSIMGTAILGLSREGLIVPDSTIATCRPSAHGHLIRVWRLACRDAAQKWLNEHPESNPDGENG